MTEPVAAVPLTNEQLLAVLQERIGALSTSLNGRIDEIRIDHSNLRGDIQQLNLRERERNGNINKLFDRQKAHDEWHGANDKNIVARVAALEEEDHDQDVRRRLLAVQWKILGSGVSIGATVMGTLFGLLKALGVI